MTINRWSRGPAPVWRVPGWVGVLAVLAVGVNFWMHSQFVPPVLAGAGLGLIGAAIGAVAGVLVVGYLRFRSK